MKCFILVCALASSLAFKLPIEELARKYAEAHPNTDRDSLEYELVDGDIMVNPDRVACGPNCDKWPGNTIYYEISSGAEYTSVQLDEIQAGIDDLVSSVNQGSSCLSILPRSGESDYIRVGKYGGCSSFVGIAGGMQTLSLENGCFRHGTIMHEFMHALGFEHEHKRSDRDDYVLINFDNIEPGKEHNFDKLNPNNEEDLLDSVYDYGSVMHYSAYGFAVDDNIPTIIPNDPDAEIGQRDGLSQFDIEKLRHWLEC